MSMTGGRNLKYRPFFRYPNKSKDAEGQSDG
jgi:hypothetical protein